MGVEVVVMPTIREPDGLAMSSRNVQLSPEDRKAAPEVYRALCQAYRLWGDGERRVKKIKEAANNILRAEPRINSIDYVSVASMATLDEMELVGDRAILSVAVQMGSARLIDNLLLE